jgi:CubicO group peptidase (beta-lactamase class C family)
MAKNRLVSGYCFSLCISVIISSLLFCSQETIAQGKPVARYDFLPVQNKIQSWIDSGYYPGVSIIVVKENKTIYEQYFGSYAPETVAYIASAGKWLAAATIAAVVDEGKLSWGDKVKKWLPEFTDIKGEATLRQLLSHTSGYPDYQPAGHHPDNYQSLKESVAHIVQLPADTIPGAVFHYGGLAMQVAGRMAELATGRDWEMLFREKIAGPLRMTRTHFTPVDPTPGHNPMLGGGARTALQDYAHFLSMIGNNGMFEGRRILSVNAIKEMQADQVGRAAVNAGEYVEKARGSKRKDIYGLGEWREEVNEKGEAELLSSPSWAGAYPWIDKKNKVYGFFLARISTFKNGFSSFYASPVLPLLVRDVLNDANPKKIKAL